MQVPTSPIAAILTPMEAPNSVLDVVHSEQEIQGQSALSKALSSLALSEHSSSNVKLFFPYPKISVMTRRKQAVASAKLCRKKMRTRISSKNEAAVLL